MHKSSSTADRMREDFGTPGAALWTMFDVLVVAGAMLAFGYMFLDGGMDAFLVWGILTVVYLLSFIARQLSRLNEAIRGRSQ